MRMWKIKCEKLCRKHLLGEHLEMHMFASCIKKKKNLKGYINKGLIEIHNIKKRHDELAKEIIKRGYKHKSPMKYFKTYKAGKINIEENEKELKRRCKECKKIIKN